MKIIPYTAKRNFLKVKFDENLFKKINSNENQPMHRKRNFLKVKFND